MTEHLALILAACLLDVALGDPVYRWHPIRLVGDLILAGESLLFAIGLNGRLGGVLHWLLTAWCALGVWFGIRTGLDLVHPWLAFLWDLYIAYSLLCLRGLMGQGWRVLRDLEFEVPHASRTRLRIPDPPWRTSLVFHRSF